MQAWLAQHEFGPNALQAEADSGTVEPTTPKRICKDEEAQPPKKSRKKHKLTVVLNENSIWGGDFARRLFPSEVYPATTVAHSFARRRGVTRTPGCAVAMYRNRHQSPCISEV